MKKIYFSLLVLLAGSFLVMESCKHEPDEMPGPGGDNGGGTECDTLNISYPGTVYPILEQYCLSCHSGETPDGGLDFTDYSIVATLAENGTLLGSIRHEEGYEPMPQGMAKLSDCDISKIEIWVRDTTFTEPPPTECDTLHVTYPGTVYKTLEKYCLDCHSGPSPEAGLDFTDYNTVAELAESGLLLGSIRQESGFEAMPPNGLKLTDCEIRQIEIWIEDTTFVEPPPPDCDTISVTYPGTIVPILEQFCLSCHSGPTPEAGFDFTDYNTVAFLAENGTLMGVIKHELGYTEMPPSGLMVPDCEISQLDIWIRDTTFSSPPGGIPCDPDTVYFQNTILPLLQSSCGVIGCHDPGTATERIILTDYNSIMNTADVEPFNPRESKLYKVMIEDDPDDIMPPPPRSPLTAEQKAAVFNWIAQGALNNYCDDEECDTINVTFSGTVWPIVQNHCFGCHSGGNPSGGISIENHADLATLANNGSLMGAIRHEAGYSPMPKNGMKLSDCKITQIQIWIDDGTPNN